MSKILKILSGVSIAIVLLGIVFINIFADRKEDSNGTKEPYNSALELIDALIADRQQELNNRKKNLPYSDAKQIKPPQNADDFIGFWEYMIDGKSFDEIADNYALKESDTDVLFHPGFKYMADNTNVMTDGLGANQTFYFGKDENNLVCSLNTFDYYMKGRYVNKNYIFPEAGENKAVGLVICNDYYVLASDKLCLVDMSNYLQINDADAVEKAINEYTSGNGDYTWLKEYFDFDNQDYMVLVKFENEIVYQLIGRVKVDISKIEEKIVSAAWQEVLKDGQPQYCDIERYDILTTENSYRVRFFANDSEYDNYDLVKLEKSTLKPNSNL